VISTGINVTEVTKLELRLGLAEEVYDAKGLPLRFSYIKSG
jgi:hypothetical protein